MANGTGTEYAIRYYRDQFWAERFAQAGIPNKPVGWQLSMCRYEKRSDAMRDITHINHLGPVHPCELVILYHGRERA